MNNTINLCNIRSRRHYLKWLVVCLIVTVCCLPSGLLLLMDEPFTWGNLALFSVGLAALFKVCTSLLVIFNPSEGKLGKSVQPYFEGTIDTDIQAQFARIEKDLAENGLQFGYVWVGKEWFLGGEAMRIDCIRGIFSSKIWRGKRYEYAICLVDDQQNIQTTTLTFEKQLDALDEYLTNLLPRAAGGDFKDYTSFIAKSEEDMTLFNEQFLRPKEPEEQNFVLKGIDGVPTSLVTSALIRQTMEQMQPGEHFMLTSMIPLKSAWGESYDLSCHRIDGEGPFVIVAYFAGKDNESIAYTLRFIPATKAYAILSNYFEKREVPDVSDWENQTHRLNQHTPLEDYVLYVDGHKYDHITYDDVMVSWEELNEGKCKSILLRTPSWQNGYMGVVGSKDKYTVEVAGFDSNHEIRGFRTQTKYGGHVTYWLSDYFHEYKYPEIRADWEDISEEVRAYNKN